jgi:hypothetical protein
MAKNSCTLSEFFFLSLKPVLCVVRRAGQLHPQQDTDIRGALPAGRVPDPALHRRGQRPPRLSPLPPAQQRSLPPTRRRGTVLGPCRHCGHAVLARPFGAFFLRDARSFEKTSLPPTRRRGTVLGSCRHRGHAVLARPFLPRFFRGVS